MGQPTVKSSAAIFLILSASLLWSLLAAVYAVVAIFFGILAFAKFIKIIYLLLSDDQTEGNRA